MKTNSLQITAIATAFCFTSFTQIKKSPPKILDYYFNIVQSGTYFENPYQWIEINSSQYSICDHDGIGDFCQIQLSLFEIEIRLNGLMLEVRPLNPEFINFTNHNRTRLTE
jgi:hypothetical protein